MVKKPFRHEPNYKTWLEKTKESLHREVTRIAERGKAREQKNPDLESQKAHAVSQKAKDQEAFKVAPMKHAADAAILRVYRQGKGSVKTMNALYWACEDAMKIPRRTIELRVKRLAAAGLFPTIHLASSKPGGKPMRATENPLEAHYRQEWKAFGNIRLIELYRAERSRGPPDQKVLDAIENAMSACNPNKTREKIKQMLGARR